MSRKRPSEQSRPSAAKRPSRVRRSGAPRVRPEPRRVVIERLQPQIDDGRFPIKRTVGEAVFATADVFADGHDRLAGVLKYRREGGDWQEVPLAPLGDDAWGATFVVSELGEYEYTFEAWIDRFGSWLAGLVAWADAGEDVAGDLLKGAELIDEAVSSVRLKPDTTYGNPASDTQGNPASETPDATHGNPASDTPDITQGNPATDMPDAAYGDPATDTIGVSGFSRTVEDARLREIAAMLRSDLPQSARVAAARDPELKRLMDARADRRASTQADRTLRVSVDPVRARFGAWYEMFPRSCTSDPARGGTLRDAEQRLPDIAAMGFDVLYLPPVHPIGSTNRKGRNNAIAAAPGDPGSPWAIGSQAGGHTAVDPGLGTLGDFDHFVAAARDAGLEVALDIAFQASPDHPWARQHPEWFQRRADGSIKYAENPPKKYQDIYPFDFESENWRALWNALRHVFLFWIAHGVHIFRVDNPHTKPFRFWEWLIADVRRRHPDTIFLAEAFTRPKLMRYLAKAGFNQSYTYFTWRNSADELREYLTELTRTEVREYLRPNFFANTPDILHEYLQTGGRPAFEVRLILAATLSASYGIYSGFELCENVPVRPGSEEYLHSEKYEIRPRDWNQPGNLNALITRVNRIRREHAALHVNTTLAFHGTDNPALLWFSKSAPSDRVFVVANTDPRSVQHGHVHVPVWELGIGPQDPYVVEDLLDGARYTWRGEWNYVKLSPGERMAHIFVMNRER